ncbi:unnamed protein product [Scytosiphon promiscuus]
MVCVANARCRMRDVRWLTMSTVVALLSCDGATGFVPSSRGVRGGVSAAQRGSRLAVSPCRPPPRMASGIDDSDKFQHHHNNESAESAAAPSWSKASRTAAACLATAAILSTSIPAGAAHASLTASGVGGGGFDGMQRGGGGGVVMLLADNEGGSTSADGRADVSQLMLELKRADKPDTLLNSMVKINDVLDADEDGVLENPFAAESIVKGLIDKRRAGGEPWDSNTETAFGILKRKLDPFNVVLLRPYLKIAPFLGGAYYLAAFFVQQKFRDFFPYAYFGAVAVFVAPALIIILSN